MKTSRGTQFLLAAGLLLALFVGAGISSPRMVAALLAMAGTDAERFLTWPLFTMGDLPVTPIFLLKVFLFVLVLSLAARLLRHSLQHRVLPHTSMEPGQQYALARFTSYVFFVLGLIIGLQSLGLHLESLVVVGGALGIGIGLGLQGVVSNFVAGLILLVERPIKLGDRIEVENTYGDVVRIAGRSTWVRTDDNVVIIVPNSEFINHRVTNWTANDRQVRFNLSLGVSYGSNPEEVRDTLIEVARNNPDVLADPAPEVLFTEFGESSLNFVLRAWTITKVQSPRRFRSDLYFAIFRAFRERGIQIPFPQRDLHLKSSQVPLVMAGQTEAEQP